MRYQRVWSHVEVMGEISTWEYVSCMRAGDSERGGIGMGDDWEGYEWK